MSTEKMETPDDGGEDRSRPAPAPIWILCLFAAAVVAAAVFIGLPIWAHYADIIRHFWGIR